MTKRYRKVLGFIQDNYGDYTNDHDNLLDLTEICDLLNKQDKEIEYQKNKASSWKITASEQMFEKGELVHQISDLKAELYAERTNTAEVMNEYSKSFKRHSVEFIFMMDLAEDLGVDCSKLEAKDD